MNDSESARRPRWITLGELIALAALIVSGLGVWISWKSSGKDDKLTQVIERRQSVPLTLRGKREDDGVRLEISAVESSHALQSLKITLPGAKPIEVGSDGELDARDVESVLNGRENEPKDRTLSVPARIDARYTEAGNDHVASGNYVLRYQWKGGGLFGGRSLHLVGLSR
jgi:hypothetical protein